MERVVGFGEEPTLQRVCIFPTDKFAAWQLRVAVSLK